MPLRRKTSKTATPPAGRTGPFGWIPPATRTKRQWEAHEKALMVALAPPEDLRCPEVTAYTSADLAGVEGGETPDAAGDFLVCVLRHMMAGDGIANAIKACLPGPGPGPVPPPPPPGPSPGKKGFLWWPYTYGQSRHRMGDDSEGEGCTGAAWAAAAREDGMFFEEETPEVEPFTISEGWMMMTSRDEYKWSAGPWSKAKYGTLAATHLVKQVVAMKDADDAMAHVMDGWCLTHASDYGTSRITRQGTPPVMLAEWNDTWPHQMSCSDAWEHPSLGLIFDDDNTWGPTAHPAPVSGEDPGGFWIPGKDYTRICKSGEVYAYKGFAALTQRQIRQALDSLGADDKRYNLKALAKQALGTYYRRIHQVTGSCVGAGGGTMLMHLYGLELLPRAGQQQPVAA